MTEEGAPDEKKEKLEFTIHIPLYKGCHCPHQYSCGKKPCEDGECPEKERKNPIYIPTVPYHPWWEYQPIITWNDTTSGGVQYAIPK